MKYDPKIHHRRSIRIKKYDYSQAGLYFITICTHNKLCLFGQIDNMEMCLNDAGLMINHHWPILTDRFNGIKLNEFIVMPNHFHGIIETIGDITDPPTVGEIVGAFKSITTNVYIRGVKQNNWPRFDKKIWQRNYYEHVIRDEESYLKISEYIQTNPLKWLEDIYYV